MLSYRIERRQEEHEHPATDLGHLRRRRYFQKDNIWAFVTA